MSFIGFAELQEPSDLLKKLKHDLKLVQAEPGDQYAAFNFFVTAEHLVDWCYPDKSDSEINRIKRTDLRDSDRVLQITSHIANGIKHFHATARRHKSVSDVKKLRVVEKGYVEEGYSEKPLIIYLNIEEKKHLVKSAEEKELDADTIRADRLAELVYNFWDNRLSTG